MATPDVHPSPPAEPDWTDQVTDLVVDLVDSVRDKTTGPVLKVARGVVYGTVALIVVVVLAVVGLAFLVRAVSLLPGGLWMGYVGLGIIFSAAGFFLWSKRVPS